MRLRRVLLATPAATVGTVPGFAVTFARSVQLLFGAPEPRAWRAVAEFALGSQ